MNENMNRQQAELNEAALENVSGGSLERTVAQSFAQTICSACDLHSKVNLSQHINMLADYLMEHGLQGIHSHYQCPYFKQ